MRALQRSMFSAASVIGAVLMPAHAASIDKGLCEERIAPSLQKEVDAGLRAGFVAALVTKKGVACATAVGMADRENNAPMTVETRFRIASMTKPVTSVAIMQLVERGDILLNDPIERFIPAFANPQVVVSESRNKDGSFETRPAARSITIHDLLTHRSGIGYFFPGPSDLDVAYMTTPFYARDLSVEDAVNNIAALPLYHDPGEKWRYSYATDILGRIVEVVSGLNLENYMLENIFEPLGMDNTEFYIVADDFPGLAVIYAFSETGTLERLTGPTLGTDTNANDAAFPIMSGGAGLVSTIDDYARFTAVFLNEGSYKGARILSPSSIKQMMSDHTPLEARPEDWRKNGETFGLGGSLTLDQGYRSNLASPGEWGWGGYWNTWFRVSPRDGVAAILFSQTEPNEYLKPSRSEEIVKSVAYGGAR